MEFFAFEPGLVGGHCICVDPYYLTYKSVKSGYHPKVILSGREVNDQIGLWVVEKI
jgi:UDP-N-acetyl-D-galactosamine dehydrogenase